MIIEYPDDDQLWLWEDSEGRPVRRFEDDSDRMLIGLDTSLLPVRAILTEVVDQDGSRTLCPLGCATFEELADFSHYWNQNWKFSGARLAVPDEPNDPLGVRAWLGSEGYPMEKFPWMAFSAHMAGDMTLKNMAIGREFEPCYALALYAHYRANASQVLSGIFEKLLEIQFMMNDMRTEVHRMAGAFTTPTDEIPF